MAVIIYEPAIRVPTNNLDIQNIDILTAAINEYLGTLIVVAHDQHFLGQIHIETSIRLE